MDKVLLYNRLYGCYQELLTEREQEVFSLYYEENLSMGEIAEMKGISRSAVGAMVKNVEEKLDKYETILHKKEIQDDLTRILNGEVENVAAEIERILQK